MWVRFTGDFDYRKPSFTVAYKAGMTQSVTAECADRAVAAGKAVRLTKPNKDAAPVEAVTHAVVMPTETKVEEHGTTDDAGRPDAVQGDVPAAPEHN